MTVPSRIQGLVFPLELTSGKHTLAEGVDLIESSLRMIISWPLFTREYVDDFGSRIHQVLEDQNDDVLIMLLKRFVVDSIAKWEKRIELKSISLERPEYHKLIMDLTYLIKDINIEDTFRYDFYTN